MIPVESPYPSGAVMFPTGMTPRFHQFYDSLEFLHAPDETARMRLGGPDCDTNRNKAMRALPKTARWVLFLDDDQTFQPDTLMRLLGTMYGRQDVDALTGLYVKKVPAFEPVLYKHTPEGPHTLTRLTYPELAAQIREHGPLMRVGGCGAGMLLVKREVLDAVGDPWFNPGPGRQWGGDLGLGGAMLAKGLKLWADLSIPVGHSMPSTLTPVFDKGVWYISIQFGEQSFRIPVEQFQAVPHGAL